MKRFIAALTLFFLFISLEAKTKQINLRIGSRDVENPWEGEERIPTSTPFVAHDDATIYIYTDKCLENLQIAISDRNGHVLFLTTIHIEADKEKSFGIDNLKNGQYLIELLSDADYYYGYFEIAQ